MGSYLKALGLLRIVGRQADGEARGWWRADLFRLRSRLDEEELVEFLVEDYSPTPVVSPWNGGSGFYPKDARRAIDRIAASRCDRLNPYREAIAAGRAAVAAADRWPSALRKERLVAECRGAVSDAAVEWLDCALCFTVEGLQYPPLLISGGNDGRQFSNNFMQRLCDVLPELADQPQVQAEQSRQWLRAALFGRFESTELREVAVGFFDPGAAGGANATAGFDGNSLVNPWDYVLTIEGSLLFAAAAARRLGRVGGLATAAFPFTVRPLAAGALWGGSEAERVRAEVWMPLWGAPAALAEVQNLCGEGRAEWRGRQAADALDFAKQNEWEPWAPYRPTMRTIKRRWGWDELMRDAAGDGVDIPKRAVRKAYRLELLCTLRLARGRRTVRGQSHPHLE
jgi:CRISPR-associated protein Csx17